MSINGRKHILKFPKYMLDNKDKSIYSLWQLSDWANSEKAFAFRSMFSNRNYK